MAVNGGAIAVTGATPIYELEIPDDTQLIYHVHVRNRSDGNSLGPSTSIEHAGEVAARGVFACLKSCFEKAGHVPVIKIVMPEGVGRGPIHNNTDWELGVLAAYNVTQGEKWCNVIVDIFV